MLPGFASRPQCPTRVHTSNASVWLLSHSGSPMRGSALVAGKFRIPDTFSTLFALFPSLWTCMRMPSMPGQLLGPFTSYLHDLVLLLPKFDHFESSGCVLTHFGVLLAAFASAAMSCVHAWFSSLSDWFCSTSPPVPLSHHPQRIPSPKIIIIHSR